MSADVSNLPGLMPSPHPRPPKRKAEVLEEEAYMEALEAIIERDYFPDVPKLQSKLEWLEAVKSGNPSAIRRAQINIARRRAGLKTPVEADFRGSGFTAPSTSIPPAANLATPALTPLQAAVPTDTTAPAASRDDSRAPNMSLDQYLQNHTSEDNASFSSLVAESEKRRRVKYQHHLEDKNKPLLLEGPFPTDEYGTSGQQPDTRRTWHHTSKSWLYYDSSEHTPLPLSITESASLVLGPPKVVESHQTRLPEDSVPSLPATVLDPGSAAVPSAAYPPLSLPGAASTPAQPGYNVLATPSYAPGVDASPFMTWGDIESTPLRLDADDISLDPNHSRGPQFSLNPVSVREEVARSLASHASKSLKHRALGKLGGGAGANRSAATPLSEAGQRLASKLKGVTGGGVGDRQLRASYTGTPLLQRATTQTPVPITRHGTPFRGWAGGKTDGGSKAPAGLGASAAGAGSITDNLLKL